MKSSEWGTFIDEEWRQRKDEILELFPDIAKVFFFFLLSTVNMWGRKPLVLKLLRTFQCPLLDKHPSVFCWLVLVWQRRPGHTDSCWLFQATVLAVGRLSSHHTHTHTNTDASYKPAAFFQINIFSDHSKICCGLNSFFYFLSQEWNAVREKLSGEITEQTVIELHPVNYITLD